MNDYVQQLDDYHVLVQVKRKIEETRDAVPNRSPDFLFLQWRAWRRVGQKMEGGYWRRGGRWRYCGPERVSTL